MVAPVRVGLPGPRIARGRRCGYDDMDLIALVGVAGGPDSSPILRLSKRNGWICPSGWRFLIHRSRTYVDGEVSRVM
jgi:hypothetical protein